MTDLYTCLWTQVYLGYCNLFQDQGLVEVITAFGSHLRTLNLAYTAISGEELADLDLNLPALQVLCLNFCSNLTDLGLCQLLGVCGRNLKVLKVPATNISGEGLSSFPAKFDKLETLNLTMCRRLTPEGLFQFLRIFRTSRLKNISLLFCPKISGDFLD